MIKRIGEQAERWGEPLDEAEQFFLWHLPRTPSNPAAYPEFYSESPTPIVRDFRFEKLCTLAKGARLHDLQTRRQASAEWEFATAVLQLSRHPMLWLLEWGGAKKTRPPGDVLRLLGTAILVVLWFVLGATLLSSEIEGRSRGWQWAGLLAGGGVYGAAVAGLYLGARHWERSYLRRSIEKSRPDPGWGKKPKAEA